MNTLLKPGQVALAREPYGHDLLNLNAQKSSDFNAKPGWLRVSLHFTHSINDIDYLLDSLKKAVKKLR